MKNKKEKTMRDAFERNLSVVRGNGIPDLGDILVAGGISKSDVPQYRKYVMIYSLTEDVIKAAGAVLRHFKCKDCGGKGGDCRGCVNRNLRKAVSDWTKCCKECDKIKG